MVNSTRTLTCFMSALPFCIRIPNFTFSVLIIFLWLYKSTNLSPAQRIYCSLTLCKHLLITQITYFGQSQMRMASGVIRSHPIWLFNLSGSLISAWTKLWLEVKNYANGRRKSQKSMNQRCTQSTSRCCSARKPCLSFHSVEWNFFPNTEA